MFMFLFLCTYLYVCLYVCMCIYFSLKLSDPNLRADQVEVPVLVAKVVTFPEKVSRYNINKMHIHTYIQI
jgi:hypothetical protein